MKSATPKNRGRSRKTQGGGRGERDLKNRVVVWQWVVTFKEAVPPPPPGWVPWEWGGEGNGGGWVGKRWGKYRTGCGRDMIGGEREHGVVRKKEERVMDVMWIWGRVLHLWLEVGKCLEWLMVSRKNNKRPILRYYEKYRYYPLTRNPDPKFLVEHTFLE